MDRAIRRQFLEISRLLNVFLAVGFIALSLVSVTLAAGLAYALSHQRYTIVPPTVSGAFTLSQVQVDNAYLTMMSDYFLHLKFDVTPSNVHRQYGRLLDYIPASLWPLVQPTLLKDAERIRHQNVSSHLDILPDETRVDINALKVKVSGILSKAVGERQLPTQAVDVHVKMDYHQGTIRLLAIHQEARE